MVLHLRINTKSAISILATVICISVLLVDPLQTYFDRSFRTGIYVLFFSYIALVAMRPKKFALRKAVLFSMICNTVYAMFYFFIGPGSYLMVSVMTVCIFVPLLYSAMVMMNYDVLQVWKTFRTFQLAIYGSLVAELLVVILGYQDLLRRLFPAGTYRPELFGYGDIHNTFSSNFNLGFKGLASLALTEQAFSQFCVMLTILGFRYLKVPFNLSKMLLFVLVPIVMSVVSPSVTSVVILVSIVVTAVFIKAYLNIYSCLHVFGWIVGVSAFFYVVYDVADLGFVRTYNWELFYDIYVGPQLDFVASRSLVDYLIGVDASTFEVLRQQYEVALLSYMSATGAVFFILNIMVVVYLFVKNLQQIKQLYRGGTCSSEYLEAQIMNLLYIVAMLVSTVHYPVIGTYIGSAIFIFNLSLGFYILHANRDLIRTSRGSQAIMAYSG